MSKRAIRRYRRSQILKWTKFVLELSWGMEPDEITPRLAGVFADNLKRCTCGVFMCGNRRKYHGELTQQELKSRLDPDFEAYRKRYLQED